MSSDVFVTSNEHFVTSSHVFVTSGFVSLNRCKQFSVFVSVWGEPQAPVTSLPKSCVCKTHLSNQKSVSKECVQLHHCFNGTSVPDFWGQSYCAAASSVRNCAAHYSEPEGQNVTRSETVWWGRGGGEGRRDTTHSAAMKTIKNNCVIDS